MLSSQINKDLGRQLAAWFTQAAIVQGLLIYANELQLD
tara:strand:+ start:1292 stop:1405 length:114 start_codon:yes stop_codon:yes gene_type:complete